MAHEIQTTKRWDVNGASDTGEQGIANIGEPSEAVTEVGRPKELKKGLPIKRVPSDDCLLYPNKTYEVGEDGAPRELKDRGEGVVVHEGEWVEIVPMASMLQYLGLEEDSNEALDLVCEGMSKRLVRWNWTDIVGDEYPQPFRNPAALRALEDDELSYLILLFRSGETEAQAKND